MPPKRFACSPRRFSPLTSLDDVPETSPLTTPDGHTHSYHLHRDKLTLTPNLNVSSGVFPFGCQGCYVDSHADSTIGKDEPRFSRARVWDADRKCTSFQAGLAGEDVDASGFGHVEIGHWWIKSWHCVKGHTHITGSRCFHTYKSQQFPSWLSRHKPP